MPKPTLKRCSVALYPRGYPKTDSKKKRFKKLCRRFGLARLPAQTLWIEHFVMAVTAATSRKWQHG